ncbi:MAG: 23S rRNA (uracil(1939)-C(5))-methyltransferase RlmD [Bacteroidales bacterium]|nr:23S rRNA (uracil(1939)-C(5))-methyltransferase RlmD [Bacteroidales bacterium]
MSMNHGSPMLNRILITDIGAEGNAIARVEGLVIFIPMLVPGDVVDIRITRKKRNYLEGRVIRFHEYSPDRIKPLCRHFGVCGGCKWQHLPYELQLKYKEKQVTDTLTRIGKVRPDEILPVVASDDVYYYRNKLEYTFSDRRWFTREELDSETDFAGKDALGFHVPGFFDKVLDIKECHLQPEPSGSIRNAVRRYAHRKGLSFFNLRQQSGFLRNLIIRSSKSGDIMVIVVFFLDEQERIEGLLDYLSEEFPRITSLWYIINRKKNDSLADQQPVLYRGDDHLTEEIDGLKFRIGAKSFFQTNTCQAEKLYAIAREFAGLTGKETVYDLYTGTGTIAAYMASRAARVIGIEYIEEAVRDARINSEINNIKNTEFIAGDLKDVLSGSFFRDHGYPDVVITDPPRAGMHPDVVRSIMEAGPGKIVYISCNPATQARDISMLAERYEVEKVQPVDMFPQTHHVENVALLKLKNEI